jgi:hypothetical protein
MQHKIQLGGNKFISKVRVFKPDVGSLPYMLFYINGPALGPVSSPQAHEIVPIGGFRNKGAWSELIETHVVKRTTDSNNVLREYITLLNI